MNLLPYWPPVLPIPAPVEMYVIPCGVDGFVPEYTNLHSKVFRMTRMARNGKEVPEHLINEIARLSHTAGL